ncbi:MAG: Gfo/Idh/MocA family oxidoreductase [Armatimonadetes bacterium]|nr:Gfo/Idh/MocA family oxidoreductase [Armatimonadota bacterium]MDW8121289.1 Gfo/Idh/MocA family oxidoreductase [Armatimonadota bacterium]
MAGTKGAVRCAVIGYGGAFSMGKYHCQEVIKTNGLQLAGICDVDPQRLEVAKQDFPEVPTFSSVRQLLERGDFDLAIIVTPHNTHASIALQCLKAGKSVVVEKPMCLTVKEATEMIEEAKKRGLTLTVYHNRNWDGDFLALKEIVDSGLIGRIFHVEMWGGDYHRPGPWWRSDKKVSGGLFYDWGAHYLWWLLSLVPSRIVSVAGHFHKLKWDHVTNEDHVEAIIRFEDGTIANVQMSTLAAIGKPRWRILGTEGAIVDAGGRFQVSFFVKGLKAQTEIPYQQGQWHRFYENLADHFRTGAPLAIAPEKARRVIAIMEMAEKSSRQGGRPLPIPYE